MNENLALSALLALAPAPAPAPQTAGAPIVEPLPAELAERYAPAPLPPAIALRMREDRGDYEVLEGRLDTVAPAMPFQLWRPKRPGLKSIVVVFPILGGGGKAERHMAAMLAGRGHLVVSVLRPDRPFRAENTAADVERLFRTTICGSRALVVWAVRDQSADPDRVGVIGFSMGGIASVTFLAAEPRARRSFIALAGADVAGIIRDSQERGILRYLAKKAERGVSKETVVADFRDNLLSDPLRTARYVRPAGMVLVRALADVSVPAAYSEKLWKLLGRPPVILLPTGHYTTAAFYLHLKAAILKHFSSFEQPLP